MQPGIRLGGGLGWVGREKELWVFCAYILTYKSVYMGLCVALGEGLFFSDTDMNISLQTTETRSSNGSERLHQLTLNLVMTWYGWKNKRKVDVNAQINEYTRTISPNVLVQIPVHGPLCFRRTGLLLLTCQSHRLIVAWFQYWQSLFSLYRHNIGSWTLLVVQSGFVQGLVG